MNGKCIHCGAIFEKQYKQNKFCSRRCSNRKNLNNKHFFDKPKKYSRELAELFGILLGDGSVTKYYIKIYLNLVADKGYAENIIKLITAALPKVVITIKQRPRRGTEEIQVSSKDVCDYMGSLGFNPKIRNVPYWIVKNKQFSVSTLRGLFDTEGSIGVKYFHGKNGTYIYKQLTFTNKNKNLLEFVRDTLVRLEFSPTKTMGRNIYISNKKDIDRYFKIIGTTNPKLEKKLKLM